MNFENFNQPPKRDDKPSTEHEQSKEFVMENEGTGEANKDGGSESIPDRFDVEYESELAPDDLASKMEESEGVFAKFRGKAGSVVRAIALATTLLGVNMNLAQEVQAASGDSGRIENQSRNIDVNYFVNLHVFKQAKYLNRLDLKNPRVIKELYSAKKDVLGQMSKHQYGTTEFQKFYNAHNMLHGLTIGKLLNPDGTKGLIIEKTAEKRLIDPAEIGNMTKPIVSKKDLEKHKADIEKDFPKVKKLQEDIKIMMAMHGHKNGIHKIRMIYDHIATATSAPVETSGTIDNPKDQIEAIHLMLKLGGANESSRPMVLQFALEQAGFKVENIKTKSGSHLRVHVAGEGAMDIDISKNEPFKLKKLHVASDFVFKVKSVEGLPNDVPRVIHNGEYQVQLDVNNKAGIEWFKKNYIKTEAQKQEFSSYVQSLQKGPQEHMYYQWRRSTDNK